jgi:hypothetical protein
MEAKMLKLLGRILVVLLVVSAVAGIVYFAVQGGSTTSAANSVAQGFRGEGGGHDEGGASLGGLVGVIGNIGLVSIMTLIVTALGQIFSTKPGKTSRPQPTNL